jgi:hypothetical protein
MSEWWTYSLSDFLLFSPRTYYRQFELYNAAIFPAQAFALALGVTVLALLLRPRCWSGRFVGAVLAAGWLWAMWFYLLRHYEPINWAARYYAVAFAIEALLLLWTLVLRDRLRPLAPARPAAAVGACLVAFAVVIQPLPGPLLLARPWSQAEVFGVAPDPTIVATLGVLTAAERPQWHLLILPLAWCAVGGATLWTMRSPEAPILPAAAAVALALAAWKSLAHPARETLP